MHIVDITDAADPRLDDVRDLNHSTRRPDLRSGAGLVIAEGVYVVGRMLSSRVTTRAVVGTGPRLERLRSDASAEGWNVDEAAPDVPFYRVSRDVLSEVIGFASQRDIVAAADRPEPLDVREVIEGARTVVVLEGVNDAENIGAIFRGVAAFGADAVLFGAATGDPYYRRVVRVSMGHVLHVPHAQLSGTPTTWQRSLAELEEAGFAVIALTPQADETLATAVARLGERAGGAVAGAAGGGAAVGDVAGGAATVGDVAGGAATGDGPALSCADRIAFLVGAEGPGLTEHAMRAATSRAAIPMAPGTDSINVATATTLALYERFRET